MRGLIGIDIAKLLEPAFADDGPAAPVSMSCLNKTQPGWLPEGATDRTGAWPTVLGSGRISGFLKQNLYRILIKFG